MSSATVTITGLSGVLAAEIGTKGATQPREALTALSKIIDGVNNGTYAANVIVTIGADAVRAAGTLTLSSASGTVGGVINGTSVTATWATSDTNSAALVAAAINANTTVNKLVSATSAAGVVTVTANVPGVQGGAITFTATGTGVTASGSGKLAGTATGAGADAAPVTYSLA